VDVWLSVSVVVCAGAFGSNASFYSDSTILSAASTNTPTMTHAITQLNYAVLALVVSTIIYGVMGYLV